MEALIVEDNEAQSKLMVSLLKAARYAAQTAASAEEALQVLQWFSPGLILVDLQISGLDGLEFVRRLRADPARHKTLILALTSFTHHSDLQRAREAGCDGHIPKPLDAGAFLPIVREFSRGVPSSAASANRNSVAEQRNSFLAEAQDQGEAILRDLASGEPCAMEVIQRLVNRWAEVGGSLGFREIAAHARDIAGLLGRPEFSKASLKQAVEMACRGFEMAARSEPILPYPVMTRLRVGLAGFSEEEARRIREAAEHSNLRLVFDEAEGDWGARQTEYDALIVNHCAGPGAMLAPEKLTVPAVFITSRPWLQPLSKLPSRSFDFLIAPWDAEEVLMRLFRLIGTGSKEEAPEDQKTRPRVLVADDDPDMIALVVEVLRQSDIDCDIARNGVQALSALRERLPDALVLDIEMPDLDGFEVLKRVRRNVVTEDLPVLMLTASGQRTDVARSASDGADEYMLKPFRPYELALRITRLVSERARKSMTPARSVRD